MVLGNGKSFRGATILDDRAYGAAGDKLRNGLTGFGTLKSADDKDQK